MQIVIVTGLSGAGKSTALRALEDIEFTCVDNIPVPLVGQMVDYLAHEGDRDKLAIAIDARQRKNLPAWHETISKLRSSGHRLEVMFLDASEEVLLRRFSETRRIHPLESKGLGVSGLIEEERRLLDPLRERADVVIDTGGMNVYELRETLRGIVPSLDEARSTKISLTSFGYKYGHPLDADIIFDVRFMPNPYWVAELRDRKGTDKHVKDFLLQREDVQDFVAQFMSLIEFILPGYNRERRPYLSIGIGCTGGRHRSVVVTNELAKRFKKAGQPVTVTHRDINK